MTALFASDVHLGTQRPEMVTSFVAFLRGPARHAEHLYLLGDVFDEWLGDDDAREPYPQVEGELRRLVEAGCDVCIAHGNHDFLLGPAFLARTGVRLLDGPEVHEIQGERVLLMHGDELCTDDLDYQAFRAQVRNPSVQQQFLSLPMADRITQVKSLRAQSVEAVQLKTEDIMDVAPGTVLTRMAEADVRYLIHGHTHRPAVHQLAVGGQSAWRIVLGDWYEQDSVLEWNDTGFSHRRLSELAPG